MIYETPVPGVKFGGGAVGCVRNQNPSVCLSHVCGFNFRLPFARKLGLSSDENANLFESDLGVSDGLVAITEEEPGNMGEC